MNEDRKLVTEDYLLENETIEDALKRLGIDISVNPGKYVIEYDGAMDDGYDNPLTSFSVYEIVPKKSSQVQEENSHESEIGAQIPEENAHESEIGAQIPEENARGSEMDSQALEEGLYVQGAGFQGPEVGLHGPEVSLQGSEVSPQSPAVGSNASGEDTGDNGVSEQEKPKEEKTATKIQRKVIRIVQVVENKAPIALIAAALLSTLLQFVDIDIVQTYNVIENLMNNLHININDMDIGLNILDGYNLHDDIYLNEGTAAYEISGNTGDVATIGSNPWALEGNYDISGVAIRDANGNLIDSIVDLHEKMDPVNIGEYAARTCAEHGIDPSNVEISIHLGNEVDGSTLGWKNAAEVFPNFSIPQPEVSIVPDAGMEQIPGTTKLEVNFGPENVNPVIPGALAAAAGASALSTHRKNKENEKNPLYKEFETMEEYEEWKQKEYSTAEEEYENKSFFGKIKARLFSKHANIQKLSDQQVTEFDERILESLPDNIDLEHANIKIREDGHIIVDSVEYVMNSDGSLSLVDKNLDVTADAYNNNISSIGSSNPVVDTLPLTELTSSQIDEIAEIASGRTK